MDERELRAKAEHYKRMALLVTDEATKALLELAAKYEAVADNLIGPPGGQPPISTMRRTGRLPLCAVHVISRSLRWLV